MLTETREWLTLFGNVTNKFTLSIWRDLCWRGTCGLGIFHLGLSLWSLRFGPSHWQQQDRFVYKAAHFTHSSHKSKTDHKWFRPSRLRGFQVQHEFNHLIPWDSGSCPSSTPWWVGRFCGHQGHQVHLIKLNYLDTSRPFSGPPISQDSWPKNNNLVSSRIHNTNILSSRLPSSS